MKENMIAKAREGKSAIDKLNRLREELHHLILQEADRKGAFNQICFVGGTALRILHGLDRFSEDLDFSLSLQNKNLFQLETLSKAVVKSLEGYGFDCHIERLKTERNVQSCLFAFRNLLHQLHKSFQPTQKLAIRFEADMRPPAGAHEQVSPVTGIRLYKVRHFDLPSLFAGKLHAVLYRVYTKGRDLYDFLWYTGKGVSVNGTFLENAIEQTQKEKIQLNDKKLQELLHKKFEEIDFAKAQRDVAPFLADPESLSLFDRDLFLNAANGVKFSETVKK